MNNKALFRELPYYSYDIISSPGQFNNGLNTNLPTKKYLDGLPSFKDLDLFALNGFLLDKNSNFNTFSPAISCKYYSEGLNGVNRQPSNGLKINRQPSKTEYFYRQPPNDRA